MKMSARNHFAGTVIDVKKGQVMAQITVDIGGGNIITSLISAEAVKELDVKVGEEILALIKATSVMLGKE